jgi:hypothetical protein
MAEFMIIVVPEAREYAPEPIAIQAAVALVETFFPDRDDEVNYKTATVPMFVTSRDAFETLTCPECGEVVQRFDLEEDDEGATWWDGFEERLYASADAQREVFEMPCCSAHVAAGDMDLGNDATFARLNLWLHRPGDSNELTSSQTRAISQALGCEVKWMTGVNS